MSGSARYDVVVLGGGPGGCAAALGLARQGVERVLVVESGGYDVERIGESIPPDTRALFAELGVLGGFLDQAHEPCLGSCSSWGADELGYNDFLFNPNGNGWHLDRRRFDAWMAARAQDAGVELRTATKFVDRLGADEHGVELGLQVGLAQTQPATARARARFVIDATGQRSRYARRCGARPRTLDQLVVSSGFFELPDDAISRLFRLTMLEAVEDGWWYLARLPRRRVAVAIATSPALHKRRRLDRAQGWLEALAATRHILPKLLEAGASPVAGSLSVCTAPSFLLDPVVDPSPMPAWLAVGDAASSFDPISSQGIYKALSDGLASARAVAAHLRGDAAALPAYARSVQDRFTGYAQQRAYFYGIEQRWTEASFWRDRVAVGTRPA